MNSCFLENPVQRTDETHGITWNIYTQSIYYSSHLLQTTDKSALQTLPKGMSLFSFKVLGQSPSFAKDGNEQFKCTYYVLTMKIFHLISALTLFLDFLKLERLTRSWIFGLLEVVQIGQKCVRFQSPIKHPDSVVATISMTRILVHRDEKFFVSTDKVFQSVELIGGVDQSPNHHRFDRRGGRKKSGTPPLLPASWLGSRRRGEAPGVFEPVYSVRRF